jgi:hypothetical protein
LATYQRGALYSTTIGVKMKKKTVEWLDRALIIGPRYTLCTTKAQFAAALKEIKVDNYDREFLDTGVDACVHYFGCDSGPVICIVCVNMKEMQQYDGIEIAVILVHESVHIWQKYVKYIGEQAPSKEFEAYSIEAISEGLMREYAKQTK